MTGAVPGTCAAGATAGRRVACKPCARVSPRTPAENEMLLHSDACPSERWPGAAKLMQGAAWLRASPSQSRQPRSDLFPNRGRPRAHITSPRHPDGTGLRHHPKSCLHFSILNRKGATRHGSPLLEVRSPRDDCSSLGLVPQIRCDTRPTLSGFRARGSMGSLFSLSNFA